MSDSIKYSGYCTRCECNHALFATPEAIAAAQDLLHKLDSLQRVDFDAPNPADDRLSLLPLLGKARGHMFGVMTFRDSEGNNGVAKAFSGMLNGLWQVEGWADPVIDLKEFDAVNTPRDNAIFAVTQQIQAAQEGSPEQQTLILKRRQMSQESMARIFELYRLPNFRGEVRQVADIYIGSGKGVPTGTGDCCAPKLIAHAILNGLRPTGLAEFYWGKENRSGTKRHGAFYGACEPKCQPILGFMLCGLED